MSHFYKHFNDKQYPLEVVTDATPPSVILPDAKEFLREDRNVEDNLIKALISASETAIEEHTGYVLVDTVYRLHLGYFENVRIPKKPFKSSSLAVKYDDESGVEQTLDLVKYTVYEQETPVRIQFTNDLPNVYSDNDYPVRIEFTVGFGVDDSAVPKRIQTAVKILCMFFHKREITTEEGENINPLRLPEVQALLSGLKFNRFH
jgi:uncharacterized phiE125 gp8 family phage protein